LQYVLALNAEDFAFGIRAGSGPDEAWGDRQCYDFEADQRRYKLVLLELREPAVTVREEARPELWNGFSGRELRCGMRGGGAFSAETSCLLGSVLEALNAV
jgi:hypothetical protein